MNRLFRCAMLAALVGMFAACSAIKLNEAAEQQIQTVGILTLVTEDVSFKKIGLTVFNNEENVIQMNGLIAATMQAVTTQHLGQTKPAWKIKDIDVDRGQLMSRIDEKTDFFTAYESNLVKEVTEIAQSSGVDALLVFYESETDHVDKGVAVRLNTISLSSIQHAVITTTLFLTMIDSRGQVIAESTLDPGFRIDQITNPTKYGLRYKLQENYQSEVLERLKKDITKSVSLATENMLKQVDL